MMLMSDELGIEYENLAYATFNGFAAMGTNNGHNGTSGVTMLHNPDVIEDFAWRAYVFPCSWDQDSKFLNFG